MFLHHLSFSLLSAFANDISNIHVHTRTDNDITMLLFFSLFLHQCFYPYFFSAPSIHLSVRKETSHAILFYILPLLSITLLICRFILYWECYYCDCQIKSKVPAVACSIAISKPNDSKYAFAFNVATMR
jgi:hypothetical protein